MNGHGSDSDKSFLDMTIAELTGVDNRRQAPGRDGRHAGMRGLGGFGKTIPTSLEFINGTGDTPGADQR